MSSKTTLFTNWHTMRWVALSIGIFLAAMAVWYSDVLTGILSAFFLIQAITNTGCMVSSACGLPVQTSKQPGDDQSEPEFTEVK